MRSTNEAAPKLTGAAFVISVGWQGGVRAASGASEARGPGLQPDRCGGAAP